jgi:hypothetical protein
MSKASILFSPALAAHLSKKEATRRSSDIQSEARERDNRFRTPSASPAERTMAQRVATSKSGQPLAMSKNDEPKHLTIRARNVGSTIIVTDNTSRQYLLPALLGVGAIGAGIGIFFASKPAILQKARSRFTTLPHMVIPSGLLYTALAANIICSGAILYTHQHKREDPIKVQQDLLSAWEEEATRRAKGRTLALAEHYEAHLESLQKEHMSAQYEIERRCRDVRISQAAALATFANAQRSIQDAERKAWKAANEAYGVVRRMDDRVRKLEGEKSSLQSRMRRLEADNASMNALIRNAECKTARCQEQVEEMSKRASNLEKASRSPSVGELWLDEG